MNFEELSEKIIKKTISAGATDCDVVLAKGESKSISYRLGKIEDIDKSDGRTFGIRALIGNQQAFISSSDPDNENIEKLVHKVVQMAHLAPEDDTACLGDSSYFETNFESLDLCQNNETSTEDLIEMAKECEDEALSQSGITNSEGSGASYGYSEFFLATSNGFNGGYKSSSNSISCSVIAGEGQSMERDYDYAVAKHIEDLSSPKEVGLSSAQKALRRMNPRKIKSCQIPVVFDKRISNKIIGYVAGAVSGSAIARGTSFLKDNLNQKIFKIIGSISDEMNTQCFVVGGWVRDQIMNRENSMDIDIVAVGNALDLAKKCSKNLKGSKVSVFKKFGTAHFKVDNINIEFVQARSESYTPDSRKPKVEPSTLKEDQLRRDFTINSLAISLNKESWGKLVDLSLIHI